MDIVDELSGDFADPDGWLSMMSKPYWVTYWARLAESVRPDCLPMQCYEPVKQDGYGHR